MVILSTKDVGSLKLSSKQGSLFEWPDKGNEQVSEPGRLGTLFRYNRTTTNLPMEGWTLALEKGPAEADCLCILIQYIGE